MSGSSVAGSDVLDVRPTHRVLGADLVTLVALAVPAALVLASGWSHRWTTDDGFINVRIVQQILDGNGPVFNEGERVEVGSSPAWILLLVVGRVVLFWLPTEWIAVVLGIIATTLAVVLAQLAAVRLYRNRRLMPFGIIAFIALPPVWDFATAGLETGLSLLWIAGSQLALVAAAQSERRCTVLVAAATIGVGSLVRPDFLVMTIVFAGFLVAATRAYSARRLLTVGAAFIALPAIYEIFRIGYYGALVPNTVFAKEATRSNWMQGSAYLRDFIEPYELLFPLAVSGAVLAMYSWKAASSLRLLLLAPVVAGVAHAFFVVRGGGDHMHGRLLIPALFAILLPVAAIPRNARNAVFLAILIAWTAIPLWSGGPPYDGVGPKGIANERTVWISDSSIHPVVLNDFRTPRSNAVFLVGGGDRAAELVEHHRRGMLLLGVGREPTVLPLDESVRHDAVVLVGAIGMVSVAAGTDVYVADVLGLADPIGARIELTSRSRPGHEKVLPPEWMIARFADVDAPLRQEFATPSEIEAASAALRCESVRELLARAQEPLSLSRLAANAVDAFTEHGVRISRNPREVAASCQ